jgi:beta-mannosidase
LGPLDAFHSRDAERVERAVALYADLGCNMLRAGGGNVYEITAFSTVRRGGILVWQDMAYACGRTPNRRFPGEACRETLRTENLRNPAALALWLRR